jgi:hypothetical protein
MALRPATSRAGVAALATTSGTTSHANPISPANPATTQPSGPNSLPVPSGTINNQNPQTFDPGLSPGYQK